MILFKLRFSQYTQFNFTPTNDTATQFMFGHPGYAG